MQNDEVLLTAAAIGERLGLSKHSVYKMAAAGKIPTYACGAKLSARRFDLAEVLAALKVPVKPDAAEL
jgi:excisionase family DNA binding protein